MDALDVLDRQLISLLQKKGRMSFSDLARTLKISEATVRRRVERLLSSGVMEIVACVDPRQVGMGVEAMVYLQVDLDKLTQIGQRLAAMPDVREVIYTSGAHDLAIRVVLGYADQLLPFLTQRVATIPGIKSTQTAYVLQMEKRMSDWLLPELVEEQEPAVADVRILIVDDDADFVAAATMVLEAEGYHVLTASSGSEAIALLRGETPDVILLDLIMETPLAGIQVARFVAQEERLRQVPVLAISAIRSSEWADSLPPQSELPFDDFVDKPIEPQALLAQVRRLISRNRSEDDSRAY